MPSGNFSFVIDSSFQPFSMQELLTPYLMYKEAYEKAEDAYADLSDKAGTFKYLSKSLPENSKARKIYEGYAKDLESQAKELSTKGLLLGNRSALSSLRRRYKGEIGRLEKADEAMREAKKLRRARLEQDSSMLYATDAFNIDEFLDDNEPDLFGISGTELYARGKEVGRSHSSRIFSSGDAGQILGGYFRDYVEKNGYSPEVVAKFRKDMSTIPELQMAADALLDERGVSAHLTGNNLERARLSVINGIIDGIIYTEKHNPVRDPGVMSAKERGDLAVSQGHLALSRERLAFDKRQASISNARAAQAYADERRSKYILDANGNVIGTKKDLKERQLKLPNNKEVWSDGSVRDFKVSEKNKTRGAQVSFSQIPKDKRDLMQKQAPGYVNDTYYNFYKGKNGQYLMERNGHPEPYVYYDTNTGTYLDEPGSKSTGQVKTTDLPGVNENMLQNFGGEGSSEHLYPYLTENNQI